MNTAKNERLFYEKLKNVEIKYDNLKAEKSDILFFKKNPIGL